METKVPEHAIYKGCEQKDADAEAWIFTDKNTFTKFYYKLPKLGDDEVLGRVRFAGICHSDSMHGRAKWYPTQYPTSPGHEVVAEVLAVGPNVKDLAKGDTFLVGCMRDNCRTCKFCQRHAENLCRMDTSLKFTYGKYFGGFGTHIQLNHEWCFKAPKQLKLECAAPLMCAGITTFAPLKHYAKKGDKVAILGVGGLGHVAVQWASKMGFDVIALVSNLQSKEKVEKLGAKQVVDWVNGDLSALRDSIDVILCTLPIAPTPEQMGKLFGLIAPCGHFVEVGAPSTSENLSISPLPLIMKEISIHGSAIGNKAETVEMLQFAADHGVEIICEHFPFEEFPKALDRIENGKPYFRCVVDVDAVSKKYQK